MRRRARIMLGLVILSLSLVLLIWGFMPFDRVKRVQPISPSDLQLPLSSSLLTQPIPVS